MANLYIFGNGFDIHHGLDTKYLYFKKFLETKYDCSEDIYSLLPESIMDNHGNNVIKQEDRKQAAAFLYNVIQESVDDTTTWSHFENALGKIDTIKKYYGYILNNQYNDDEWKDLGIKETLIYGILTDLQTNMELLSAFFSEWIDSIKLDGKEPDQRFISKFNSDDFYLNFNYTTTLEDLYNCKNVTHIHGKAGKDELVIGHCKEYESDNFNGDLFDSIIDNGMEIIHNLLKKPTERIINDNSIFFSSIANVDRIIVFGWGYGEEDYNYFRKIKKTVKSNVEWILCYHNEREDKDKLKCFKEDLNINGEEKLDKNFIDS